MDVLFCVGVGLRGQVLTVTKKLARNVLIPTSAAIYASPENLMKNEEERKVSRTPELASF